MKKLALLLAVSTSTFAIHSAFAQSSVAMYGVIDTMIRHTNNEVNADGSRGSNMQLEQGVFQGPRLAKSNSGGPLANTSLALSNLNNTLRRIDNVATAGLLYQATPAMAYTFGYMTDFVKNESSSGNSGRLSTVYAVADYSLSKRTDIYLNLDYTRLNGGEIDGVGTNTVLQSVGAGLGGAKNRTGIAIGLRTRF